MGVVLDDRACPVSSEVRAPLEAMVSALRRAGVTVTEGWPEGLRPPDDFCTYYYLLTTEIGEHIDPDGLDALRTTAARPETSLETVRARALTATLADYERQQRRRIEVRAAWAAWFRDYDVLLLPTAFTPAFPHMQGPPAERRIATPEGVRAYTDLMWWIHQATLAGLPATTAPVGHAPSGLPVGVQIVGPCLEDATPIAFAHLLADVCEGYEVPHMA